MKHFSMHIRMIGTIAIAVFLFACGRENDAAPRPAPAPGVPQDTVKVPPPGPAEQTGVTARKVRSPKSVTDFLLQLPETYNKDAKKWPVIIFLHGVGERGSDVNMVKRAGLAAKAARDPNFPYIVVSPQCKENGWWDSPSLEILLDQVLKDYRIDPARVYLTGLSMGGYGSWDWALFKPERFAAVVPICGGGVPSRACVLKNMPVWAFHNADDLTVNVQGSRDMVNAIRACGSTLVKYTENPTGGHDSWTKAYNDPALYTWLNQYTKK
ncbi:carboxylesterase family protein [Chitinophaga deserti]|uniref:carboxylesterase family protein n=1 Tax=Chitinophaga deserti TaxID=2164099 RepID=UPI0018E59A2F|nr:alpha/beta hydrolase-fold protein [Chitinophaga deserti]